jgi:chromosomal replication initiator protein
MPAIDLNPNYTFEEFVVGSNSQFAYSAALAVAKDPGGTKFNPLLIYGGVGLGKTHLLQAIGNHVIAENSRKKVRYVTSEAFYREFVESIQHNRINELSTYYRNEVDVLLMDDVQFMSGKDRTQEEFFHIFNSLHQSRKQIVLTSDAPPGELKGLEDRLVSRFQWGLFAARRSPSTWTSRTTSSPSWPKPSTPISASWRGPSGSSCCRPPSSIRTSPWSWRRKSSTVRA